MAPPPPYQQRHRLQTTLALASAAGRLSLLAGDPVLRDSGPLLSELPLPARRTVDEQLALPGDVEAKVGAVAGEFAFALEAVNGHRLDSHLATVVDALLAA